MYTINAIESLNRLYRKYIKIMGAFTRDKSLMTCLFLTTKNVLLCTINCDMIYKLNILS